MGFPFSIDITRMHFRNLTPFSTVCFHAATPDGVFHPVVVMKVAYRICPVPKRPGHAMLTVIDDVRLPVYASRVDHGQPYLTLEDESDLEPFKPACEVFVAGKHHAQVHLPDNGTSFLMPDDTIQVHNLVDPRLGVDGRLDLTFPGHRPFVILELPIERVLVLPMLTDTVHLDTDALTITLTHRMSVHGAFTFKAIEARFEVDPRAPLLRSTATPTSTRLH